MRKRPKRKPKTKGRRIHKKYFVRGRQIDKRVVSIAKNLLTKRKKKKRK